MMKRVVLALVAVCMLSFAVAQSTATYIDTAYCFNDDLGNALSTTEWSQADVKDGMLGVYFNGGLPGIEGAKYFGDTFVAGYAKGTFTTTENNNL